MNIVTNELLIDDESMSSKQKSIQTPHTFQSVQTDATRRLYPTI